MELAELRARPHTSISQLKVFLQCPRKYDLLYVSKVEPAFRALALVFGTAWHATIQERLVRSRPGEEPPIEELRAHLRDGLLRGLEADGPPVLFEEEQDAGTVVDVAHTMLDAFLERVPLPEKVLGIEVPFALELVHPKTGEVLDVPLVGAMDALVTVEGTPSVWELKTAARRWTADGIDYDMQSTAYAMAARELGHMVNGATLIVTTKKAKPDVQIERLVRHRRDENELAEVAFSVRRAIHSGVDHPLRGWQCRSCPFAHACGV